MVKKKNKEEQRKFDEKIIRAKQITKSRQVPIFPIVAFDQATVCGFAWQTPEMKLPNVELWNLSIGSNESKGMKWLRFESRVKERFLSLGVKAVAYELPGGRNTNPIIHSAKLICVIEKICSELGIDYIELSSSEVKKFATGNGNANKPMMIEYAKKLWGYEGKDDNEADALHILQLLKAKIL